MTAPPPPVRVVTGPDGRMQTEALPPVITPEQLAELHRQTMDRITGNEGGVRIRKRDDLVPSHR